MNEKIIIIDGGIKGDNLALPTNSVFVDSLNQLKKLAIVLSKPIIKYDKNFYQIYDGVTKYCFYEEDIE